MAVDISTTRNATTEQRNSQWTLRVLTIIAASIAASIATYTPNPTTTADSITAANIALTANSAPTSYCAPSCEHNSDSGDASTTPKRGNGRPGPQPPPPRGDRSAQPSKPSAGSAPAAKDLVSRPAVGTGR